MKPTNNKSLYHSAAKVVEECDADEKTVANRDLKLKALKIMLEAQSYELKRLKVLHETGDKSAKLREIEITNPEV